MISLVVEDKDEEEGREEISTHESGSASAFYVQMSTGDRLPSDRIPRTVEFAGIEGESMAEGV